MNTTAIASKPHFEQTGLPRGIGGVYSKEDAKEVLALYQEYLDPLVRHTRAGMSGMAYGYILSLIIFLLALAFNKQSFNVMFDGPFKTIDFVLGVLLILALFSYVILSGEIGKFIAQHKTRRTTRAQKLKLMVKALDEHTRDLLQSISDYEMRLEYVQLISGVLKVTRGPGK